MSEDGEFKNLVYIAPSRTEPRHKCILKMEIDYGWICDEILRRCKRTVTNNITEKTLREAFLEMGKEQK